MTKQPLKHRAAKPWTFQVLQTTTFVIRKLKNNLKKAEIGEI